MNADEILSSEDFKRCVDFHGHICPGLSIGYRAAKAGLERENSRGAHFREDFPDSGTMVSSYFTVARKHGDKVDVAREAVQFTIVKPGETVLPDGEPETLVEVAQ
jgi:formylmethanofuran dehydrogenase subunit E-like metal-binding protein